MMRKNWVFFLMIVFAAGSLSAGNLFSSGTFESSASGWNLYVNKDSGAAATMSVDTVEAKEGKKCLKIEVTATANDPEGCNWHVQLQDPTWPAKKGVQYRG